MSHALVVEKFGVGQSVRRVEDPRLIQGLGRYSDDVNLPRQLYAVVVRSPHAHARIRSVDTAAARAAQGVHAVLTPTAPSPAFKIGEKTSDPLAMYLADIFTVTANIAGIPAISVPSGQSPEGLPFGIQFMTQEGREDILFGIGRHFETIRA